MRGGLVSIGLTSVVIAIALLALVYRGAPAGPEPAWVGWLPGASIQHYYERDGPHCRLLAPVVADGARGHGIGGRLVEAVEAWARGQGARTILVTSALHRADPHRFYEDRGYARTGYRFVKPLEP